MFHKICNEFLHKVFNFNFLSHFILFYIAFTICILNYIDNLYFTSHLHYIFIMQFLINIYDI